MTLALACLLMGAIGAPHVLRLERAAPAMAAIIWLASLVLRASTMLLMVLFFILVFPSTQGFSLVTHWCLHAVLPFIATHLPLDGHSVGDAAVVLPAFVLAASAVSVLVGVVRATRAVERLLGAAVLGDGPRESLILADGDVVVAVAGIRRPRVVVSAGALTVFDDDELSASLEHEHGHIAHHHRWVLLAAELCRGLGRFLPGTRAAARELAFHLERDADQFALRRTNNPSALASAICKTARATTQPQLAMLGGGSVSRRVRQLLEDPCCSPHRARTSIAATAMVLATFVAWTAVPTVAVAGLQGRTAPALPPHTCD